MFFVPGLSQRWCIQISAVVKQMLWINVEGWMPENLEEGDCGKLELTHILRSGQLILSSPVYCCHVEMWAKTQEPTLFSAEAGNSYFHVNIF